MLLQTCSKWPLNFYSSKFNVHVLSALLSTSVVHEPFSLTWWLWRFPASFDVISPQTHGKLVSALNSHLVDSGWSVTPFTTYALMWTRFSWHWRGQATGYADDENWSISDKTRGDISLISVTIFKKFAVRDIIKGAGYFFRKVLAQCSNLFKRLHWWSALALGMILIQSLNIITAQLRLLKTISTMERYIWAICGNCPSNSYFIHLSNHYDLWVFKFHSNATWRFGFSMKKLNMMEPTCRLDLIPSMI